MYKCVPFVHSLSYKFIRVHLVPNNHLAGDPLGLPQGPLGVPGPHFENQCCKWLSGGVVPGSIYIANQHNNRVAAHLCKRLNINMAVFGHYSCPPPWILLWLSFIRWRKTSGQTVTHPFIMRVPPPMKSMQCLWRPGRNSSDIWCCYGATMLYM